MDPTFNPPLDGNLLWGTVAELVSQGFKFLGYYSDEHGKYAARVLTAENFPFILVAKGSDLMGDIISFHKGLLEFWKSAIVLVWQPMNSSDKVYYVFDPSLCLENTRFENVRGSDMCNFSIRLGKSWLPKKQNLSDLWKTVKNTQLKLTSF